MTERYNTNETEPVSNDYEAEPVYDKAGKEDSETRCNKCIIYIVLLAAIVALVMFLWQHRTGEATIWIDVADIELRHVLDRAPVQECMSPKTATWYTSPGECIPYGRTPLPDMKLYAIVDPDDNDIIDQLGYWSNGTHEFINITLFGSTDGTCSGDVLAHTTITVDSCFNGSAFIPSLPTAVSPTPDTVVPSGNQTPTSSDTAAPSGNQTANSTVGDAPDDIGEIVGLNFNMSTRFIADASPCPWFRWRGNTGNPYITIVTGILFGTLLNVLFNSAQRCLKQCCDCKLTHIEEEISMEDGNAERMSMMIFSPNPYFFLMKALAYLTLLYYDIKILYLDNEHRDKSLWEIYSMIGFKMVNSGRVRHILDMGMLCHPMSFFKYYDVVFVEDPKPRTRVRREVWCFIRLTMWLNMLSVLPFLFTHILPMTFLYAWLPIGGLLVAFFAYYFGKGIADSIPAGRLSGHVAGAMSCLVPIIFWVCVPQTLYNYGVVKWASGTPYFTGKGYTGVITIDYLTRSLSCWKDTLISQFSADRSRHAQMVGINEALRIGSFFF